MDPTYFGVQEKEEFQLPQVPGKEFGEKGTFVSEWMNSRKPEIAS